MTKQHVQLTPEDRDTLTALTTQGDQKARRYKRALGLLERDRGKTYTQVAHTLGMTDQALWCKTISIPIPPRPSIGSYRPMRRWPWHRSLRSALRRNRRVGST